MFKNSNPVVVRKGLGVVSLISSLQSVAVAELKGWEYDHLEMHLSTSAKVMLLPLAPTRRVPLSAGQSMHSGGSPSYSFCTGSRNPFVIVVSVVHQAAVLADSVLRPGKVKEKRPKRAHRASSRVAMTGVLVEDDYDDDDDDEYGGDDEDGGRLGDPAGGRPAKSKHMFGWQSGGEALGSSGSSSDSDGNTTDTLEDKDEDSDDDDNEYGDGDREKYKDAHADRVSDGDGDGEGDGVRDGDGDGVGDGDGDGEDDCSGNFLQGNNSEQWGQGSGSSSPSGAGRRGPGKSSSPSTPPSKRSLLPFPSEDALANRRVAGRLSNSGTSVWLQLCVLCVCLWTPPPPPPHCT